MRLTGAVPVGATCAWTFDDGDGPQARRSTAPSRSICACVTAAPPRPRVEVSSGSEGRQRVTTEIAVRDILIAGLGDSIASGEGNPDRPIALSDEGFCFRSYLASATAQYYRPGRAGYKGGRACEAPDFLQVWQRPSALWFNPACHRSLYSYQTRTALALAVRYPHIAVTYLPLACTGATIADGLFGSQARARMPAVEIGRACRGTVNGQLAELREALTAAKRRQPDRTLDLVLLSIGANDIYFSGLVADVIVDRPTERALFRRSGVIGIGRRFARALARELPQALQAARGAEAAGRRRPLARGLRVLRQSGAGGAARPAPAAAPASTSIPPSTPIRSGSPAVAELRAKRIPAAAEGDRDVPGRHHLPRSAADRMTFVDAHQRPSPATASAPARASDPEFDRACFSAKGESFNADLVTAANQPMLCGRSAGEFRAYLPRARWIRDANDSYFSAMTYPQGLPVTIQPADIHDATWGMLSAVYGGAVHPTAEGHAAMADAALPAAARCWGSMPPMPEVITRPVAPLEGSLSLGFITASASCAISSARRGRCHRPARRVGGRPRAAGCHRAAGRRALSWRRAASPPPPAPADISRRWQDRAWRYPCPAAASRLHPYRTARCRQSHAWSASARRG